MSSGAALVVNISSSYQGLMNGLGKATAMVRGFAGSVMSVPTKILSSFASVGGAAGAEGALLRRRKPG